MINIGFASEAMLAFVGLGTKEIGSINFLNLVWFEIALEQDTQVMDKKHRASRIRLC
jgi:hypothetical protein